jgi:hypothetical protein
MPDASPLQEVTGHSASLVDYEKLVEEQGAWGSFNGNYPPKIPSYPYGIVSLYQSAKADFVHFAAAARFDCCRRNE